MMGFGMVFATVANLSILMLGTCLILKGVESPEQYESYDYEMYNGTKSSEWDCLASVFWDMVADQGVYKDFYDFCECFDCISYDDLESMLSINGIEVVFISEEGV